MKRLKIVKNVIAIFISGYLLFMFFVYSGFFRDNTNPVDVCDYYFECCRNWEAYLTYPVYDPESFDVIAIGKQQLVQQRFYLVSDVKLQLLEVSDSFARVSAKLIYKDGKVLNSIVYLGKNNYKKGWVVKEVVYGKHE